MSKGTRIGVLGGTFDPVHLGHLDVARAAERALCLDRVLWLPARIPPHRAARPWASPYHRFAMVVLATRSFEGFVACDLELTHPGPSYTSRTLAELRRRGYQPGNLFFITGADAFAEIATWKDYPAILEDCHFAVVSRPGFPLHQLRHRLPGLTPRMREVATRGAPRGSIGDSVAPSIFLIDAPTADVSSSAIRQLAVEGRGASDLVPPEVDIYIRRHGLYRECPVAADQLHEPS